jgi:hypothetical protein
MARPDVPGNGPRCRRTFVADQPLHGVGEWVVGFSGRERGKLGHRTATSRIVEGREVVADGVDLRVAQGLLLENRHHG